MNKFYQTYLSQRVLSKLVLSKPFLATLLLALLLCASAPRLSAQATGRTVTADEVNKIASELWCPLCSGVRLDACELKACEQMREEIAIKLEAGEDLTSIKQYFLERYGEQVLGAPQRKGWGWLAWLVPPIVVLSAGVLLFVRGRSLIQPTPAVQSPASAKANPSDRYEEKLDEELSRYE